MRASFQRDDLRGSFEHQPAAVIGQRPCVALSSHFRCTPADYAALHDADVGRVITRLCWLESSLVIETWDGEQRPPVQSSPVDLDEGGRGLMLVTALTTAWGHYPSGNGKVVWAEILPRSGTAPARTG